MAGGNGCGAHFRGQVAVRVPAGNHRPREEQYSVDTGVEYMPTYTDIWTGGKDATKGITHFFTTISCSLSAMTIRDSRDSNCIEREKGQER